MIEMTKKKKTNGRASVCERGKMNNAAKFVSSIVQYTYLSMCSRHKSQRVTKVSQRFRSHLEITPSSRVVDKIRQYWNVIKVDDSAAPNYIRSVFLPAITSKFRRRYQEMKIPPRNLKCEFSNINKAIN